MGSSLQDFLSHLNSIHLWHRRTYSIPKGNPYQLCAITPPSHTVTKSGENPTVKITAINQRRSHSNREQRDQTYTANGFTTNTINRASQAKTKPLDTTTDVSKTYLAYTKGTTDKISSILRKHQILTIFSTDRKVGQIRNNPKDSILPEVQRVYEIPCRKCNPSRIGQTNRKISVRREKHKLAVQAKETTSA
ncbi:hypothetical protein Trydic_g16781 [Trypoxylus dichotomus]